MKVCFSVLPNRRTRESHINKRTGYLQKNAIAVHGPCRFYAGADDFWGGFQSKMYLSKVLTDPTWDQVHGCAERSLKFTKDYHHIFLEGITLDPDLTDRFGIPTYELSFGS